jgi:tRNA(fMet)-specific endonuclease VapC
MILFDTDTLTLFLLGQARVVQQFRSAEETPTTSVVSRIEALRGRFDSIIKASDGEQLLAAQKRLEDLQTALAKFKIVSFDSSAAAVFDRCRRDRGLKKIGRPDLLIACIALANRATLVMRNVRHFRQVPGLHVENWAD